MNSLQVFKNSDFGEIRTVLIGDEPYFVGKDVAEVLGYTDVAHAVIDHVDEEDRVNSKTQGQNDLELGQRGGWLINESGLYSLILSSKLPTAKAFKRWVTSEVLPSIRKHGAYMTHDTVEKILTDPDTIIMLTLFSLIGQVHILKYRRVDNLKDSIMYLAPLLQSVYFP